MARSDFTDFFWGEWQRMLDATDGGSWEERAAVLCGEKNWDVVTIPAEYLSDAVDPDPSWDRRAAWIVFMRLSKLGQIWSGPAQRELF